MWDITGHGFVDLSNITQIRFICNIIVGFGCGARNRLLWDMMRGLMDGEWGCARWPLTRISEGYSDAPQREAGRGSEAESRTILFPG